ncbi:MAG: hypothetical protein ABI597_01000 [Gammaproteobacteria bacterium]
MFFNRDNDSKIDGTKPLLDDEKASLSENDPSITQKSVILKEKLEALLEVLQKYLPKEKFLAKNTSEVAANKKFNAALHRTRSQLALINFMKREQADEVKSTEPNIDHLSAQAAIFAKYDNEAKEAPAGEMNNYTTYHSIHRHYGDIRHKKEVLLDFIGEEDLNIESKSTRELMKIATTEAIIAFVKDYIDLLTKFVINHRRNPTSDHAKNSAEQLVREATLFNGLNLELDLAFLGDRHLKNDLIKAIGTKKIGDFFDDQAKDLFNKTFTSEHIPKLI